MDSSVGIAASETPNMRAWPSARMFSDLKTKDQRDLVCLTLALGTLLIYLPVVSFDFVSFDDSSYVGKNPHVASGLSLTNLVWAFSNLDITYWHPLTWLSHQLDCQLFGLNSGAHHLVNVLLHAANTVLLFIGLFRLTGEIRQSALVGALFAIHPMHVESVAWIAERKDVLSAFFWLLSIGAYLWYVEKTSVKRYFVLICVFAAGLLSKPTVVTLPFALLLLDFWPLRRIPVLKGSLRLRRGSPFWNCLAEKVPLLVLSAGVSFITILAQKRVGAVWSLDALPLPERIGDAVYGYLFYLAKLVWPTDLCALYYHPGVQAGWKVFLGAAVFFGISALAIRFRRRLPFVLFGWLWFVVTLLPMIGLIQVGSQAVADRHTYVPYIGLFVAAIWAFAEVGRHWVPRPIPTLLASVILVCYALRTEDQLGSWQNSETLFRQVLGVEPRNPIAHANLGIDLQRQGHDASAAEHYRAALNVHPNSALPNIYLGNLLVKSNHLLEATRCFIDASSSRRYSELAHSGLGFVFSQSGNTSQAIREYEKALALQPNRGCYESFCIGLEWSELCLKNGASDAVRTQTNFWGSLRA